MSFQRLVDNLPELDFDPVISNISLLFEGLYLTLQLLGLALFFGFWIALLVGIVAANNVRFFAPIARGFIYFIRGTPLLVQLYLVYYGISGFDWDPDNPLWEHFFKKAYWCAVIAFALNTAGYTAEIIRGAIINTPKGQIEAATACGMSTFTCYRRIILPNAFRRALPAYSNETIFMLHGTALASAITVEELFGAANIIRKRYFTEIEPLLTIGLFYLCLTFTLVFLFRLLEKRWSKHLK